MVKSVNSWLISMTLLTKIQFCLVGIKIKLEVTHVKVTLLHLLISSSNSKLDMLCMMIFKLYNVHMIIKLAIKPKLCQ